MEEEMTIGTVAANEWDSVESLKFMRQLMDVAKPFLRKRMYVPSMEHPSITRLKSALENGRVSLFAQFEIHVGPKQCAIAKALALNDGLVIDGPCVLKIGEAYYLVD